MGAKVSSRRRRAFLKAYASCGNVTVAAERVGVSRSWVSLTRRAEPGFDAACRAALAAAKARLAMSPDNRPPRGWERSGGAALVRFGRRGRVQLVRSARLVWTAAAEARFLAVYGQYCNIRLACAMTGMTLSSCEAHRRRWPGFRRRMDEARAIGSERLAAELAAEQARLIALSARMESLSDPEEPAPPRTIKEVIDMVARHKFRRD